MSSPEESPSRTSRVCGVISLVLGLLALAARLALEVSHADLGSDLGIEGKGFKLLFHFGSLLLAGIGLSTALAALFTASSWRARIGLPLPGILLNGMALLWATVLR